MRMIIEVLSGKPIVDKGIDNIEEEFSIFVLAVRWNGTREWIYNGNRSLSLIHSREVHMAKRTFR